MSTFRKRQMMAAAQGGGSIPYDAEIEYLESNGTQYIDTGIKYMDSSALCEVKRYTVRQPRDGELYFRTRQINNINHDIH